jgi:hypothetical protein
LQTHLSAGHQRNGSQYSSYGNGFHGGEKVTKLNCHVVGETQSLIAASSTKKIAHGHFFNYSLAT